MEERYIRNEKVAETTDYGMRGVISADHSYLKLP